MWMNGVRGWNGRVKAERWQGIEDRGPPTQQQLEEIPKAGVQYTRRLAQNAALSGEMGRWSGTLGEAPVYVI